MKLLKANRLQPCSECNSTGNIVAFDVEGGFQLCFACLSKARVAIVELEEHGRDILTEAK